MRGATAARKGSLDRAPGAVLATALAAPVAGCGLGAPIADMRRQARRDGFAFDVAAVPADLPTAPFDPACMGILYRAGLATGGSASGWAGDMAPLLAASAAATGDAQ
ncbi:hypothetical protein [Paracoccus endophyticus]|uniref:hypothetical protein n=1 Tax=Paracoccus endophyticus TaxID=2233774 RepID=UPI000DD7C8C7|nr:hypothetical protein [Paracoccus endophyticus]